MAAIKQLIPNAKTACFLLPTTGGLQETMFTRACGSQALACTRIPGRTHTSQVTESQPTGGAQEQAIHALDTDAGSDVTDPRTGLCKTPEHAC